MGCSAALLVRDDRFLDDLLYRFREGSLVSPQLAVALGIVHPIEAVAEFEPLLGEAAGSVDPKGLFSAYAVLKLLGRDAAEAFEAGDLFRRSRKKRSAQARSLMTPSSPWTRSTVCGPSGKPQAFRPFRAPTDRNG